MTIRSDIHTITRDLQSYASEGKLACTRNSVDSDMTNSKIKRVLDILYKIPLIGRFARVLKSYPQPVKYDWQGIFDDILNAKYADALKKVEIIDKAQNKKEARVIQKDLIIDTVHASNYVSIGQLHSALIALVALEQISGGNRLSDTELTELSKKIADRARFMRCGKAFSDKLIKLIKTCNAENQTNFFDIEPVHHSALLLLKRSIETVTFNKGHAAPEDIIKQFKFIKKFEYKNLNDTDRKIVDKITALKKRDKAVIDELTKLSPDYLTTLETRAFNP